MSEEHVLKIENLSVHRGRRQILFDIDWCVKPGEHWAILGPNGCGKTSLLSVMMNYLTATSGTVDMPGRADAMNNPKQRWDSWRLQIGFVSSTISRMIEEAEPALDVILAGKFAMINFWQQYTDPSHVEEAKEILEQIQCTHLADQPWAYLSQGERQKMLIGRALMLEQLEILVLDEPCAGLDPVARESFLNFIEQLKNDAKFKSMVLVSHHVEEIVPSITHVLILKDGKVLASGKKEETLTAENLSEAFGAEIELKKDEATELYEISLRGDKKAVC